MEQKKLSVIGFALIAISLFAPPDEVIGKMLSVYGLLSVLYPFVQSLRTKDYHITIVFVFMMSYLFVPFNYFWLGLQINYYNACTNLTTVYLVLQILCLFHSILLFNLKLSKGKEIKRKLLLESDGIIFTVLAIISFVLITFGSTGKTIFEAGGYVEAKELKTSSSFFAYSVIPISLSLIYANTKLKKNLAYGLAAYFCLKDLAFGGRVDSLELLLLMFMIRFQYLWSLKKILLGAAVGALFFLAWGALRSDVNIGFWNALANQLPFLDGSGEKVYFQSGNAAEVYYSSARIIYMIENGILTWDMRIQSFIYFLLSSIVPYSALPDLANLSTYKQDIYWSGGGGLGPVFFYAFGGWIGVIVFSLFVSYCMNLYTKNISRCVFYYVILLFSTTPRWYAYYPIQIIKFCVVGCLLYYFLRKLAKRRGVLYRG